MARLGGASAPPPAGPAPAGPGGAATARRRRDADDGAQALEFVMALPLVFLLLALVLQTGLVGADLVHAQGLAREAARVAAVDTDAAARAAVARAAGSRRVRVTIAPAGGARRPGGQVTAVVDLESRAFGGLAPIWLPGRATLRVEDR